MDVLIVIAIVAGAVGAVAAGVAALYWIQIRRKRRQQVANDRHLPDIEARPRVAAMLAYLGLESLEVEIVNVRPRHPRKWSRGQSVVVVVVAVLVLVVLLAIVVALAFLVAAAWRAVANLVAAAEEAVANLEIPGRLQQQVGPLRLWLWIVVTLGTVAVIYLLPRIMRKLGGTSGNALDAVLAAIGSLSLLVLVASWLPEFHWIPSWIRDDALMVRRFVYQQELVGQLTDGWDWDRLRRAATVLVVLEGFGLWTAKQLPIPLASTPTLVVLMGLAFLQYAALGGGQPVWAIEHMVVHLMDLAGFTSLDVESLQHFTRIHFRARSLNFDVMSLRSQGLLAGVAFALALGSRIALR
jgi:hypothetical protein